MLPEPPTTGHDDAPAQPESDPQQELAELAAALAAQARRAAARGVPRVHIESAAGSAPQTGAQQRPAVSSAPAVPGARPAAAPSAPAPALSVPPPLTPTAAGAAPSPQAPAAARERDAAPPTLALAQACNTLEELRAAVAGCRACGLCETRTQTVCSDGSGSRGVVFVGEAPGADEDQCGRPFVGKSGQLLTDIIEKGMGLRRDETWIVNLLKCRTPENREPSLDETRMCAPWLDRQLQLMRPKVVIALGQHAANHLLGRASKLGELRQQVYERDGAKVVPTYHPAYLLRVPEEKKECWKDIQLAMRELGLPNARK